MTIGVNLFTHYDDPDGLVDDPEAYARYLASWAPYEEVDMAMTYEESFAHWAPIMRARWHGCKDVVRLYHAKGDINATLPLHPPHSEYAAKLTAELDEIRDAERRVRLSGRCTL